MGKLGYLTFEVTPILENPLLATIFMSKKLIVRTGLSHIGPRVSTWGIMALILGVGIWTGLSTAAQAQSSHGGCYVEDENGELFDLGPLCPSSPGNKPEPVLQTGDVQVTLRWDTNDDLDLIVVDPAGDIVDFGSPTSPSGGQLDIDANGFCQPQSFAPVENTFWPVGSAPDGAYLAYVTLAIPCSLESLASSDAIAAGTAYQALAVPYTLTILHKGVTTTYEGTSRPGEFGVNYPFTVGEPVESVDDEAPAAQLDDGLAIPGFDLPEL